MGNNTLEFFIKMRDLMSAGLIKLSDTAKKKFGDVKNYISDIIKKNDELGNSFDKVASKAEKSGSKLSNWGKTIAMGLTIAGVGMFAKSSIGAAMDFGKQQKTYEVMTGSPMRGKELARELQQLKQDTIMGSAVYQNAQTMMGFGISDKEVIKDLRMLGDISMGDAEKLGSLTLAFSQTRAAGKLMGQELLQYVNAGFNPLKELSAMTGKSMLTLRGEMEKGAISAEMVTAAFEHATNKGGKFHDMMNQIAETSFGKMQMLKGKFQAFKIDMGNMLMPLADAFMDAAGATMKFLGFHKSIPQSLLEEKAGLNALVSMITKYNEGNSFRKDLLNDLVSQYPELFKNLDIENVKNSELLTTLSKINDQYDRRINLATSDELINAYKQEGDKALKETKRWMAMKELASRPDKASHELALSMRTWDEKLSFVGLSDMRSYNPEKTWGGNLKDVQYNRNMEATERNKRDFNEGLNAIEDLYNRIQAKDTKGLDKGLIKEVMDLYPAVGMERSGATTGLRAYDFTRMKTAAGIQTGGKTDATGSGGGSGSSGSVASGITGGGPRVININGVKFSDKIEIHAATMNEGADDLEKRLEEMFLRILNSGASVQ